MRSAWVYLLECSDRSYYVGCTTNLAQRIEQHQRGTFSGYPARRRPVVLKWCGETNDIHNAIAAERQIKGWSRAKKEALIRGDWKALHELSLSTQARKQRERKSNRVSADSLRLRPAKKRRDCAQTDSLFFRSRETTKTDVFNSLRKQ